MSGRSLQLGGRNRGEGGVWSSPGYGVPVMKRQVRVREEKAVFTVSKHLKLWGKALMAHGGEGEEQ